MVHEINSANQLKINPAYKSDNQQQKQKKKKNNSQKKQKIINNNNNKDDDLTTIVKEMKGFVQNVNRELSFSIDNERGKPKITIKEKQSNKAIREIAADEIVQLNEKIGQHKGFLIDKKI